MNKRNFLLGKGERLVADVAGVRGGAPKSHPYTFSEAKDRIAPMLTRMVRGIDQLPERDKLSGKGAIGARGHTGCLRNGGASEPSPCSRKRATSCACLGISVSRFARFSSDRRSAWVLEARRR